MWGSFLNKNVALKGFGQHMTFYPREQKDKISDVTTRSDKYFKR